MSNGDRFKEARELSFDDVAGETIQAKDLSLTMPFD
jgi:hypothetical protein